MTNTVDHMPVGSDAGFYRVRFPLDDSDVAMGVEAESLWARSVGVNLFHIDNIPFYIYGISKGDTVSAVQDGQIFDFEKVVQRSGNSTYRVLLTDSDGYKSQVWKGRWTALAALGCTFEVAKLRWIAINIPSASNADDVYALLEAGKAEGAWSFDEGFCGHPL